MRIVLTLFSAFLAGLALSTVNNGMDHIQGALAFSNQQRIATEGIAAIVFLAGLTVSSDLERWIGTRRLAVAAAALFTISSLLAGFASTHLFMALRPLHPGSRPIGKPCSASPVGPQRQRPTDGMDLRRLAGGRPGLMPISALRGGWMKVRSVGAGAP